MAAAFHSAGPGESDPPSPPVKQPPPSSQAGVETNLVKTKPCPDPFPAGPPAAPATFDGLPASVLEKVADELEPSEQGRLACVSRACKDASLNPAVFHYAALGDGANLLAALRAPGGVDVNRRFTADRQTALHAAADSDRLVVMLLAAGADAEARDRLGRTPLAVAAASGHVAKLRALVAAGANKNARDSAGRTPLMTAAAGGPALWRPYRDLVSSGANMDLQDADGMTALMLASRAGFDDTAMLLITEGAALDVRDARGRTALHHAAAQGHDRMVGDLLQTGANARTADALGRTPLMAAVRGGSYDVAGIIATFYAIPEGLGMAERGHAFIEAGQALEDAILAGGVTGAPSGMVNLADAAGHTALMMAAARGNAGIATLLLAAGARADAVSKRGHTAFGAARANRRLDVATLLLRGRPRAWRHFRLSIAADGLFCFSRFKG